MQRVKETVREYLMLTLGTFLVAAGVYFFTLKMTLKMKK